MILEDVPKQLLLPFLRSIRRDDVDSHMSIRGRMARGHLRVMGGRRRIAYQLSTLAGSVNFFRTALSSAASLRIPSMSFSSVPRHFLSAASTWVAYNRAAVRSDSNWP